MNIVLDLFGFTKEIEINNDMHNRGEVDVPLLYTLDECKCIETEVEIFPVNMNYSIIRFYMCEDDVWRPRRRQLRV